MESANEVTSSSTTANWIKISQNLIICLLLSTITIACKPDLGEKPPNIPNGGRAVSIASSVGNDKNMVVASETGGLFRSVNGGDNWKHASKDLSFHFRDVMYHPTNDNIVLAAAKVDSRVISGGGIYRSIDGGANWTRAVMNTPSTSVTNNMSAHCLAYDASNGRFWTGTDSGLYFSDDDGANWNFLEEANNLGTQPIVALLIPEANKMVVVTANLVRVSTTGGSDWTTSVNGLPNFNRAATEHNQIAISIINKNHIYFSFIFWEDNDREKPRNALYFSKDFGTNWSEIELQNGAMKPPFVVLAESTLSTTRNTLDLYYSNGSNSFKKRQVIHGPLHTYGAWIDLNIDHADLSDLRLSNDGKTPILLTGDGGIHKTEDKGLNWKMINAGGGGYRALQITEVTGQRGTPDGKPDLYFGTQDNNIWASTNYGFTWPHTQLYEGFYLTIPQNTSATIPTIHTGVACGPCYNYKSGIGFASSSAWNNPSTTGYNPVLVKPKAYAQFKLKADSSAWELMRTINTGDTWSRAVQVNFRPASFPQVVGPEDSRIIYFVVQKPDDTNGIPTYGLTKITGLLGPVRTYTEITGYGNIGTFATMFAWYKVFGVSPTDPNLIIVPDMVDKMVKITRDGGVSWTPHSGLTDLVTNSGEFKFSWDKFSQISSFGFDPFCENHIMVGTQQAGIFQTFNNGATWSKVEGTEKIPFVSSFFFAKEGEVVISSYGRGLWVNRFDCEPGYIILDPEYNLEHPYLWQRDFLSPISGVVVTDESCSTCGFTLIDGGNIEDVVVNEQTGIIEEVFINNGQVSSYDYFGKAINFPFKITIGEGGKGIVKNDQKLQAILKKGTQVKGLHITDSLYNGLIISKNTFNPTLLPTIQQLPEIAVLKTSGIMGTPINEGKAIEIRAKGFSPDYDIYLQINKNEPRQLDPKEFSFDANGILSVKVFNPLYIGHHDVTIIQENATGSVEKNVVVRITTNDTGIKQN